MKYLLEQFMEKSLLGHGFAIGSCDMQGLNYVVKVGILGVALWCVFLGVLLKRVLHIERKSRGSGLPAIYVVTAVLVDVQFQAMFGSLTMAMAVFLFLDLEAKEQQIAVKN